MSIRFERTSAPIGYVQLSVNPRLGSRDYVELRQPQDRSNGGVLYSYNKGIADYGFILDLNNVPEAEYQNLLSFFLTIAIGSSNSVIYTDSSGQQFNCKFLTQRIDFPVTAKTGLRSGQLELIKV